jgi:hypothetical protein
MDVKEYFDQVQEYIKSNIENPNELDSIIKNLQKDQLQAVINQSYNNKVPIEKCAEEILNQKTNPQQTQNVDNAPNVMMGDRGSNTMERKVLKYSDFVNENNK